MTRAKKLVAPAVAMVLAIGLAACAGPEIVDDSAGRGFIAASYLEDDPTAINAVLADPEAGVGPFEGTLKEGEEVVYKVGYVFVDTPGIVQLTWVDSNDPERAVFIFGAPSAGS